MAVPSSLTPEKLLTAQEGLRTATGVRRRVRDTLHHVRAKEGFFHDREGSYSLYKRQFLEEFSAIGSERTMQSYEGERPEDLSPPPHPPVFRLTFPTKLPLG